METVPLYNFKTIVDIFTKFGTYTKQCHLVGGQRIKTITLILMRGWGGIGSWGLGETSVCGTKTNIKLLIVLSLSVISIIHFYFHFIWRCSSGKY